MKWFIQMQLQPSFLFFVNLLLLNIADSMYADYH